MSAEYNELLYFLSFASWSLSIIITSCSSVICGVLSINSQVQVRIRADEERTPTHCSIIIDLIKAGFVFAEVYAFKK